jgi:hypothetical protein
MGEGQVPGGGVLSLKLISNIEMKDKSSGSFKNMGYYKDTANGVRNIIDIFESIKEARLQDLNKERLVSFGGQRKTYDSPGKRRRTSVSEGVSLSSPSPSTPQTRRAGRGQRQGRGGGRDTPTPPPACRDTHQSAPPPTPPPTGVGGPPAWPAPVLLQQLGQPLHGGLGLEAIRICAGEQGGMRVCKASLKEDQGHLQHRHSTRDCLQHCGGGLGQ